MKRLSLFALPLLLATGCIKKNDINFKNVQIDNWQPDWALPIISSDLTLKNMVKTSTTITEDAGGLYSLHYDSKVFSAKASDYIKVPNQNYSTPVVTLSIPQTLPSFSGSFTDSSSNHFSYTDTSGAQLAHLSMKSGTISVTINSTFRQTINAQVIFPNITNAGTPLTIPVAITYPATSSSASVNLAGFTADMTNGGSTQNYLAYKIRYTLTGTGQPLAPADNLYANVGMADIQYSYIDGYLGHYTIPIPSDTIGIDVFNNTLTADIFLRNPMIHLTFSNSFGLSASTYFDHLFGLTNSGTKVYMSLSPITVGAVTSASQPATTAYTIDSTNSSVQNIFNPAPNKVIYDGRLVINPGTSSGYTFVTDASELTLSADAELPAWFKILDFALRDTLPLILPEDSSILQKAQFKMLVNNGFPVYGTIQLYFTDSANIVLDSLITPQQGTPQQDEIAQAPVDPSSGKVTGTTQQITTFEMDHDRYNAMAPRVRHAFVQGTLKSSGSGTVQIHSSDHIQIKLALRFTLNASTTKL